MDKIIKYVTAVEATVDNNDKEIESTWTETVTRKETFSINRLEQEITQIESEIESLNTRKTVIQAKIDEAESALTISIK